MFNIFVKVGLRGPFLSKRDIQMRYDSKNLKAFWQICVLDIGSRSEWWHRVVQMQCGESQVSHVQNFVAKNTKKLQQSASEASQQLYKSLK